MLQKLKVIEIFEMSKKNNKIKKYYYEALASGLKAQLVVACSNEIGTHLQPIYSRDLEFLSMKIRIDFQQ